MANWKHNINLMPEWAGAKAGKVSVPVMAQAVVDRLNSLPKSLVYDELEYIKGLFQDLAHNDSSDNEFDEAMEQLYDWGDTDHRMFIKTF